MMGRRNTRTDLAMLESGEWSKVGRKHFRRFDGATVQYDCNRWHWVATGPNGENHGRWKTLEVAVSSLPPGVWTDDDRVDEDA